MADEKVAINKNQENVKGDETEKVQWGDKLEPFPLDQSRNPSRENSQTRDKDAPTYTKINMHEINRDHQDVHPHNSYTEKVTCADCHKRPGLFYRTYIRWWIRIPIALIITFYIYLICSNVTTYQNARQKYFDLRNFDPATYGSPSGPPQDRVNLILPDLWFDPEHNNTPHSLKFLTVTPIVAIVGLLLVVFYLRNMVLIAEIAWIEIFLITGKGLMQTFTTLPDPYGFQPTCWDPHYRTWGPWIYSELNTEFCGDCIYSGHFFHFLFVLMMIDRGFQWSPCPTRMSYRTFKIIFWALGGGWAVALFFMLVFVRYHYSVDVMLALMITPIVCTHEPLIAWGRRWLYPVDNVVPYKTAAADRRRSSMDDSVGSNASMLPHSTMNGAPTKQDNTPKSQKDNTAS